VTAQPAVHMKHYRDDASRRQAEQNYQWLASLPGPLRLPRQLFSRGQQVAFEHLHGRHAEPGDLVTLADHLGEAHRSAHTARLEQAQLAAGLRTASGHRIPGFPGRRLAAVARELESGRVPNPAFTVTQAQALLRAARQSPAAFYKDANPRNFLITQTGPVVVDFDDLTLAPFGYDLAKLIVTLAMTYGPLPPTLVTGALTAYNAATGNVAALGPVTWAQLMDWAEIHHILTSRYLGRTGYRHSWPELRPSLPQPHGT
jgi:aminoglycoside phosphotransferase (APT) family kinase protein